MITLTISEENPESFLKALSAFLSVRSEAVETAAENPTSARKPRTPKEATLPPAHPVTAPPTPPAAPPAAPVVNDGLEDDELGGGKVYTQEDIKKIGREHASRVGADKVRDFIKTLGAENLTKLPADKYNAFVDGVTKLVA